MTVTPRRRLWSAAVAALLGLGIVVTAGAPANAALWFFGENFENNPGATWWFENGPGQFTDTNGLAHSGTHYADITRATHDWTSVDHNLTLPTGFLRSCRASAWFAGFGAPFVSIEIINPVNWTYVTHTQFFLSSSEYVWEQFAISWTGGPSKVVIRLVVSNSSGAPVRVKIDDVAASCVT